jgi:histidinol-phosphate aminotransferase
MGSKRHAEKLMIEPNEHLKEIRRMSERMPERRGRVHMDMNERVTPFERSIHEALLAQIQPELLCHYPDASPLYERLSRHLRLPEDQIYVTPGSDAAIRLLFQAYLRPGDRVTFPEPTFAMYSIYSQVFQARARTVPYVKGAALDVQQLKELLSERPRILAVANPDQPTGSVVPREQLLELAAAARKSDTLFIIDEAYYPFYPESAIELINDFDNVVILRTFSKVGGLAGLRVGYLVGSHDVVDAVSRVRGSFEVNTVAIAMACYLLDHPSISEDYLRQIEEGREVLKKMATALGLGIPPCPANFQLLQFKGRTSTAEIASELAARGYLVKGGFSAACLNDCVRVTLAGPELMTRFCRDCEDVLQRFSAPRSP